MVLTYQQKKGSKKNSTSLFFANFFLLALHIFRDSLLTALILLVAYCTWDNVFETSLFCYFFVLWSISWHHNCVSYNNHGVFYF